jgi:hypothetical protein
MLEANAFISPPEFVVTHHHPMVTCKNKNKIQDNKQMKNIFFLLSSLFFWMRMKAMVTTCNELREHNPGMVFINSMVVIEGQARHHLGLPP